MSKRHIPILLLPFVLIWNLLELILKLTGRLVIIVLGLVIFIVGIILSITVVGSLFGIPLIILGFMMMIRGLF